MHFWTTNDQKYEDTKKLSESFYLYEYYHCVYEISIFWQKMHDFLQGQMTSWGWPSSRSLAIFVRIENSMIWEMVQKRHVIREDNLRLNSASITNLTPQTLNLLSEILNSQPITLSIRSNPLPFNPTNSVINWVKQVVIVEEITQFIIFGSSLSRMNGKYGT